MSDRSDKITRRIFLKHTAVTSAVFGVWHSTAMFTDAQQNPPGVTPLAAIGSQGNPGPYTYSDPK